MDAGDTRAELIVRVKRSCQALVSSARVKRSCQYSHMENAPELGKVEGAEGILTIRGGGNVRGWNGIRYKSGLSAKNVGSKKLSMNVATIPPGGVAYAHVHVGFEVMLYILSGRVRHELRTGARTLARK